MDLQGFCYPSRCRFCFRKMLICDFSYSVFSFFETLLWSDSLRSFNGGFISICSSASYFLATLHSASYASGFVMSKALTAFLDFDCWSRVWLWAILGNAATQTVVLRKLWHSSIKSTRLKGLKQFISIKFLRKL